MYPSLWSAQRGIVSPKKGFSLFFFFFILSLLGNVTRDRKTQDFFFFFVSFVLRHITKNKVPISVYLYRQRVRRVRVVFVLICCWLLPDEQLQVIISKLTPPSWCASLIIKFRFSCVSVHTHTLSFSRSTLSGREFLPPSCRSFLFNWDRTDWERLLELTKLWRRVGAFFMMLNNFHKYCI